ncbi:MAG: hypothetical protein QM760_03835 [Nibricoccus sp.]
MVSFLFYPLGLLLFLTALWLVFLGEEADDAVHRRRFFTGAGQCWYSIRFISVHCWCSSFSLSRRMHRCSGGGAAKAAGRGGGLLGDSLLDPDFAAVVLAAAAGLRSDFPHLGTI